MAPSSPQTLLTNDVKQAAALLRAGQLVAFPTETVYGVGADVFLDAAVQQIFAAKGRPADNPLIAHIHHLDQLKALVTDIPDAARELMDHFFPGPLTVVLPRHPNVPDSVTAGLDSLGVRMPAHPVAKAFLEACQTPVAAPSANRSGRPSPTTWEAVNDDLNGRIACILKGDRTEMGLESTVVDCTGKIPKVLRDGAVPFEALQAICPEIKHATQPQDRPRSPGMKYRHYAPKARVVVVEEPPILRPERRTAFIGLDKPVKGLIDVTLQCPNLEDYAYQLFHFFRACDAAGIQIILCQAVPKTGIGRALMDRIEKAAAGSLT